MPAPVPAPPIADGGPSVPSLRTLGTGAHQAAAGNDSRFAALSGVSTTPVANGIPQADGSGKISAGWLPSVTSGYGLIQNPPGTNIAVRTTAAFTSAFSVVDDGAHTRTQIDLADTGPGAGTISGLIKNLQLDAKGRVVAVVAAVSGTDYQTPLVAGTDYEHPLSFTGGQITRTGNVISLPAVGPGATTTGGGGNVVESITTDAQGRIVSLTTVAGGGGGGGGVTSLANGANISIDSTNPAVPVVNLATNLTLTGTITQTGGGAVQFSGTVDFGKGSSAITVSNNGTVNLGSGLVTVGNNMDVGNQINIGGGNIHLQGSSATFSVITTVDATFIMGDARDMHFGTGTGTKLGSSNSQKLALWGATPVVQPNTTGTSTGFSAGGGTPVTDASTFTGGLGSTAYNLSDIVLALKQFGGLAL